MRYTKKEIDDMGDREAYRRYFAAIKLLSEMSGGGSSSPPPLGGGPPPQPTRRRRRSAAPTSAPGRTSSQDSADSTYNFPR